MRSRYVPLPSDPKWRRLAAVVLFLGILYGLRELAPVFICFIVIVRSLTLAADFLHDRIGLERRGGVASILLVLVGAISVGIFAAVHAVLPRVHELRAEGQELAEQLLDHPVVARLRHMAVGESGGGGAAETLKAHAMDALHYATAFAHLALYVVIGFVLSVIYLFEREEIDHWRHGLEPESVSGTMARWLGYVGDAVAITVKMQAVTALVNAVITLPVLVALGLPHKSLLFLLILVSGLLPVVGNFIAGAVLCVVAYEARGAWAVGVMLAVTFVLHKNRELLSDAAPRRAAREAARADPRAQPARLRADVRLRRPLPLVPRALRRDASSSRVGDRGQRSRDHGRVAGRVTSAPFSREHALVDRSLRSPRPRGESLGERLRMDPEGEPRVDARVERRVVHLGPRIRLVRPEDDDHLSPPLAGVASELCDRAADELLVHLRELARDARASQRGRVGQVAQRGSRPRGGLEDDDGLRSLRDARDGLSPPRPVSRQEPDEPEPAVAGEPARDQRRQDGARARDRHDWHARGDGSLDEGPTRVAHGRRPRVGHERDRLSAEELLGRPRDVARARVGVEGIDMLALDRKVGKERPRPPRVLGSHALAGTERLDRAERDVSEVPYGGGDDEEGPRHGDASGDRGRG